MMLVLKSLIQSFKHFFHYFNEPNCAFTYQSVRRLFYKIAESYHCDLRKVFPKF